MEFLILLIVILAIILIYREWKKTAPSNSSPAKIISNAEIKEKVVNSTCTAAFTHQLIHAFSPEGEQYQWMLANRKERYYSIDFNQTGVLLTWIEVNRRNKDNAYVVDRNGWGFGATGYADLPNRKYVDEFKAHIISKMKQSCPNVEFFNNDNCIRLKESAFVQW